MSETQNKSETKVWPLLNNFLQVAFNKTDISTCIKLFYLALNQLHALKSCRLCMLKHWYVRVREESSRELQNQTDECQEKIFICFFFNSTFR